MSEERLNQFCAVDPNAFSSLAELKALLKIMGSFSGWWLEDWPENFEKACRERFQLDDASAKALKQLLRPSESGFRLVRRPAKTAGLEDWQDLKSLKPTLGSPFDVVIGPRVDAVRSLSVENDEYLDLFSQIPRQMYLPNGVESFLESVSVLTITGGPTWIVDPHLAPWASNPDQDAKFSILQKLAEKLQSNNQPSELILVSTWKPEHKRENSKWGIPDPSDFQVKKQLRDKLQSLVNRSGFVIRMFLDQGTEQAQFNTHKRYLFNQHGGIEFEYGLSDLSTQKSKPKSYYGFVGQLQHKQLRETYAKCNPQGKSSRFKLLINIY